MLSMDTVPCGWRSMSRGRAVPGGGSGEASGSVPAMSTHVIDICPWLASSDHGKSASPTQTGNGADGIRVCRACRVRRVTRWLWAVC